MSVWLSPTKRSFTPSSRAASSGGVSVSPLAVSVMPSRTTAASRSLRAGSPIGRLRARSSARRAGIGAGQQEGGEETGRFMGSPRMEDGRRDGATRGA